MELAVIQANRPAFKNKQLERATRNIAKIADNLKKNLYGIAVILWDVEYLKAYSDDGFKSTADYAEKTFGIKKSQAYTMIAIGKEYTDTQKLTSNLPHEENKDFSASQIEKMLPLKSRDKAVELIKDGLISPDMSCRAIAEVVKDFKDAKKAVDSEGQEELENVSEETETVSEDEMEQIEIDPQEIITDTKERIARLAGELFSMLGPDEISGTLLEVVSAVTDAANKRQTLLSIQAEMGV